MRRVAASVLMPTLVVVLVMLGFTTVIAAVVDEATRDVARERDRRIEADAAMAVEAEIERRVDLLRALRGLFEASDEVGDDELVRFIEMLEVAERFPAITSISLFTGGDDASRSWAITPLYRTTATADDQAVLDSEAVADVLLAPTRPTVSVQALEVPARRLVVVATADDRDGVGSAQLVALADIDRLLDHVRTRHALVAGISLDVRSDGSWDLETSVDPAAQRADRTPLLVTGIAGLVGTALAAVLVATLASSRRRALELLGEVRNAHDRADAVLELAPVMIIELRCGAVTSSNAEARAVFGPDRLRLGEAPELALPAAGEGVPTSLLAALARTQTPRSPVEMMIPARDDLPPVDVLASWVDLGDERTLLVLEDVTEHSAQARQLMRAHRMEAVGLLAGGVAHDFNNLLTIIRGYTQLVLEDNSLNSDARESLEETLRASDRAAALVRQLLTLSRRGAAARGTTELDQLVRATTAMLRGALGHHVELVLRPGAGDASVPVDAGQLEQVLVNLALNARDAMPDGGRVLISTSSTGAEATLTVADTGHGIAPEALGRIFDPFFTTKPSGSGLGLAMVEAIVDSAGGTVEVDSRVGEGATFTIRLPTVAADPAIDRLTEADRAPRPGGCRVLLVDDEPAVLEFGAELLRRHGYDVSVAGDAETALQLVALGERFDVVVSDVVLPGRSGVELVAELRRQRGDVPVLLVSGFATDALRDHGGLPDGVELLAKPFDQDALLAAIRLRCGG